ncbi:putative cardiolipin synthase YwiE [Caedimonas varicaedens]|uniref:Phospholipase D n=1 Tax=Caedimonas varicaedens TaxID=1629334 RepID=A0A0K8ME79_9PROT|nr:putative cardiolipin synthase YwiE [Caedimonas varicaedens]
MLIERKIKRAFFLLSWVFLIVNVQATESYKKDAAVSDARLLVFPDNKREPFLNAIQNAQQSIQLAAYKLSDLAVMEALKKAAERGVTIDIFYEPNIFKHSRQGAQTSNLDALKKEHIRIHTHSNRFNQVHHKLLIIDGKKALIGTINFDEESFDGIAGEDRQKENAPCRDFAIETDNPQILQELTQVFNADLKDQPVTYHHPALVWGPHTQRMKILALIESAQKNIDLYQQDIQDKGILRALKAAIARGVQIRLLMMPYPFDKDKKKDNNISHQNELIQAGGHVGLFTEFYGHAKAMLIDGRDLNKARLYVGSTNFYTPSLDENRELGIIVSDHKAVSDFSHVFEQDWSKSQKNILR